MNRKSRNIFISMLGLIAILAVSMAFTLGSAFASEAYLYKGDATKITAYNGTGATTAAKKALAPDGLTGDSLLYTNEAGAGATYSFVAANGFNTLSGYNAAKFIVYVTTPMQDWTLQFGVFNFDAAKNGNDLSSANIMDSAAIRWEKSAGSSSGLKAGWNTIILPMDDAANYNGFARNEYRVNNDARANIDSFAVRTHSGHTEFELGIYSVELVALSDTVKPGVSEYGKEPERVPDTSDVALTLTDFGGFSEGTAEIAGKADCVTFGCAGWGNILNTITLNKANVKDIADSGKGALSFYFKIENEETLAAYNAADGDFNIDVCSADSYNDTNKYCFNIASIIPQLQVGWNHIILPISTAAETNAIDWTTVHLIRFNQNNLGIPNGKNNVTFGELKFTTTALTEMTVYDDNNVSLSVESYQDLTKGSAVIDEVTYDTYGCTDWGGFTKVLTLAQSYDVSNIFNSGKGAFSFYLNIADKTTLDKYVELSNDEADWIIDISSNASYSDSEKYNYNIGAALKNCQIGWNKIIVPLSKTSETNNIDWTKVSTIRLNCAPFGLGGGQNNISVCDLRFTMTDLTEITVDGLPVDMEVAIDSYSGVTEGTATINDIEYTVYNANNCGGYLALLNIDNAIDISKIANSGKGALALRFYFATEADLAAYKGTSSWNIDVYCTAGRDDSHKYSFNIADAFGMCKVGWNRIILPLATATEKNNMDFSTITGFRLNSMGSGISVATNTATADFQFILSSCTALTVEGYVPPVIEDLTNFREECSADSGLHLESCDEAWAETNLETGKGFYKQGTGAISLTGQGTGGVSKVLAHTYNLEDYDTFTFDFYVDDAASFLAMADGQLELTSSGAKNDNNEYHWSLKSLNIHDGWNYVSLNFADAEKTGEVNIQKINYIGMYFVGLPRLTKTIFDDFHAHKTSGTVIESFDGGFGNYVQVMAGKVDGATNMSGQGWTERHKIETVDVADADAIAMWIYCGDEATCSAVKGTEMELSSSGKCDINEIAFFFPNDLAKGWNYVVFPISTAKKTGGDCDLSKINFLGFVKTGLPYIDIYFDDLRAIETKFPLEESEPITKTTVISCDKVVSGVFDGMTIDDVNNKEGYAALTSNGANADEVLGASFEAVKTGLSLSGAHELGYAFWFYVDSVSKLNSLNVELSSSSDCDNFELEWSIAKETLSDGWNWITLKASEATRNGGVIDLDSIIRTRVIAFGSEAMTIKLDCFEIVDSTIEGAFDEINDVRALNPIDKVIIDDCETAWDGATLNTTDRKEGYASVEISKVANDSNTITAYGAVEAGQTDLLIENAKSNNRLGVTLWIYVEDVSKVSELKVMISDKENVSGDNVCWTVSGLVNGWNWVVLDSAEAVKTGNTDADNISSVGVSVKAVDEGDAYAAVKVLVDRISLVNLTKDGVAVQPEDEIKTRNPIKENIIISCDSVGGTVFNGNMVDKEDFRYSAGCVYTSGNGYALNATDLEIGKTDLTKDTFVLAFWVWIEDVTLYDGEGVNAQVEISSNNTYDLYEINWNFLTYAKQLENGWNWLVLEGKDADVSGNLPDFDNLTRFRLYVNNIAASTLKIDRITIGYIGNEALKTEPDWENEKADSGIFKGANNNVATNGTYIGVDFEQAEGFTVIEKIDAAGCASGVNSGIVLLGCMAIAAALIRKKNK